MWDKSKLFKDEQPEIKTTPTFKDPTTANAKVIPMEKRESIFEIREAPQPKPKDTRDRTMDAYRHYVFTHPYPNFDHSGCTSQYCIHAIGSKAASWPELAAQELKRHKDVLEEERQRKDPNNFKPYK